jgi:hypothetical protein
MDGVNCDARGASLVDKSQFVVTMSVFYISQKKSAPLVRTKATAGGIG